MSGELSTASSGAAGAAGRNASGSARIWSAIPDDRRGNNGAERRRESTSRTIGDVMREPSTRVPDVVVLDSLPEDLERRETLDPKEDLWLSTVDGRYSSPIIPLHVGEYPRQETFYVHKHVLLKSEYFEKALCGQFRESGAQSLDLPEEDPALFHFVVAYLYEGRYEPIKPAASVLVPDQDKGKNKAVAETGAESDSDSASSFGSDISAISRRRRERRRRRDDRRWERMQQKHPGMHRPNCTCPQCTGAAGPPCWSCRAPRNPPPMHYVVNVDVFGRPPGPDRQPRRPVRHHRHQRHGGPPNPPPPATAANNDPSASATATATATAATSSSLPWTRTDPNGGRIAGEDLRTWLLAYELNLDVYIMANKFLLEDFKKEVARAAVDMLESAGSDAAVFDVLRLCRKLYDGLPDSDPLLKMVFARVGFLQPWRRAPGETDAFLMANPEIAPLLLREMAARREDDVNGRTLPSMVRPWYAGGPGGGGGGGPFAGGGVGGPPPPHWVARGDVYGPVPVPGPWYGRVNGRY
ncbi:uncharacterized protein B0T15DRAFT_489240 [Chaetomium strumarium]|uniref:BTB domain-containing protein n=1 Tax=Chaetomium strumarium TaxID=1170767 RepID=A0AAJ0M6E1_9PEZI|nr:hypothetical protein B0T15DRAFT_489240 [Chaetomium strumarium]